MFLIPPCLNIKTKTDYWRRSNYCSFRRRFDLRRFDLHVLFSLHTVVVLLVLLKALTGVACMAGTNVERREHEEQKSSTVLRQRHTKCEVPATENSSWQVKFCPQCSPVDRCTQCRKLNLWKKIDDEL